MKPSAYILTLAVFALLGLSSSCSDKLIQSLDKMDGGQPDGSAVSEAGANTDVSIAADTNAGLDLTAPRPDGKIGSCDPQDAVADGACATPISGFKWNGLACVAMGSGCACKGTHCAGAQSGPFKTEQECINVMSACLVPATDGGPVGEAGAGPCNAQDAKAVGTCLAFLTGMRWDGSRCVPMGNGCSCQGQDCSSASGGPFADSASCNKAYRNCGACRPSEATATGVCAQALLGALWNGQACTAMPSTGCQCTGNECTSSSVGPYSTLQECQARFAGCP
ncbi:MAG: hypothetical protein H6707_16950 [Deltaproteobacteria bacterium]|nr:hypothetical protein [Deltaproteobacteria bacterium]